MARSGKAVAALVLALLAALPGAALADPSDVTATAPFHMPGMTPERALSLQLMLGHMSSSPSDLTLLGIQLGGEFPITRRLSLEAVLPVGYESGGGRSGLALGNVTAGAGYTLRAPGHGVGWAVGGSVSFPTAPDSGDGRAAAFDHSVFLVPFPGYFQPRTTTLRLRADARIEERTLFLQLHLASHMLVVDGPGDVLLMVLGVGGGVRVTDRSALIAEVTTVTDILDHRGSEYFLHTLDVGFRHRERSTVFGLRLYLPVDDTLRSRSMVGVAVDVASRF